MLDIELDGKSGLEALLDTEKSLITKMVSIHDIEFNPLNNMDDTQEEIELFAESIYQTGKIKSPLNVYPTRVNGYRYRLLGGDRRLHALLINEKKYNDAQTYVPVVVENAPADELEEEIRILELNENRKLDDTQLKKLCSRYLKIYRLLEERNEKPKGELRKWMASKISIGEKKAEMYIHELEGKKRNKKNATTNKYEEMKHFYDDLATGIQRKLQTKVKITSKTITFNYTDVTDLNRLLEILSLEDIVNK